MRYVHLPGASVDTALLEDATRRGRPLASHSFLVTILIRSDHIEAAQQASKAR